ncbi:hypothetical protein [Flavobacterium lindanitolerans]|jgi:hypothetical protein|uniref:hypothetical protein n=1 Tax=Flavobacterium lindanitolerans TaxID=428988 RepID=UPI0023F138CB|nr:hypothetical protein [Flavobacterium lindanitolerans]
MTPLETEFKRLAIDFNNIGFYDSHNFLKVERHNPIFLEKYAEYVLSRAYFDEYIRKAELEIPFISSILNKELIRDGRLGACIDVSIVLSRILEKEGFWNYIPKGSLSIDFPTSSKIKTKYFWSVDVGDFQAGHCWVVAPPFNVIDLSVKQQPYMGKEQEYIPDYVCSESKSIPKVHEIDIMSPTMSNILELKGIKKDKLNYIKDNFEQFQNTFKPIEISERGTSFKYITTAISAPDNPLETITTLKLNDKYGIELYNDLVVPELKKLRM